jgi:hypothetical protein
VILLCAIPAGFIRAELLVSSILPHIPEHRLDENRGVSWLPLLSIHPLAHPTITNVHVWWAAVRCRCVVMWLSYSEPAMFQATVAYSSLYSIENGLTDVDRGSGRLYQGGGRGL